MSKLVLIQRNFPEFREAFFDSIFKDSNGVLICSGKVDSKITMPPNYKAKKYYSESYAIKFSEGLVFTPLLFFKLLSLRPNVIVTEGGQNTLNNLTVLLYSKIMRSEYIVWDLGKNYKKNYQENVTFLRTIYNSLYIFTLKFAKKIFTYSNDGTKYFSRLGFGEKVEIIKNTVDTNKINTLISEKKSIPYDLKKIKDDYPLVFLFVGAINAKKNIESLINIKMGLISKAAFLIVGKGEEDYVYDLKEKLGQDFFFYGYRSLDELSPFYAIADISILPGLGGLSINQSMSFGVPVLCSSADGSEKDLVTNDVNGFIYKTEDEAADFVNTNMHRLVNFGANAKNFINQHYSIEIMKRRFLESIDN